MDKHSPNATSPASSSHTNNCAVSEFNDQDPEFSGGPNYQLPAIASIIDGCDNNTSGQQYNTIQNTTIINQQNLIVWCT